MKTTPAILTTAIISAASLLLTTSGQAEVRSWTGGYAPPSGNTPWSNSGNWSNGAPVEGDTLYFQGAQNRRSTNTNDYAAGTLFNGITFATNASNFTLAGNAITLSGTLSHLGTATHTISLATTFSETVVFDTVSTGTVSYSGSITSTHGLTKTGVGSLNLRTANAISGDVTINGGKVNIAATNALGTTANLIITTGTLDFNVASTTTLNFASLTGSEDAMITNSFTSSGSRLATINVNNATDNLYQGSIQDGTVNSVILNKQGVGTLTLTGNLTSGTTSVITGGVLQIGNGGTKGVLEANVSNQSVLAFNRSDETTFAHYAYGSGKLQQLGTGTLILTGSNSYSGGTDLVNGTVQLGSTNAMSTSGSGTINFLGGILKHTAENTRDYSGKFSDIEAGKQARIDTNGQAVTYASALNGAGGLEKRGEGSLTLSEISTYTGATNVSAGTLMINGSIGTSSSVNIANGAILAGHGIAAHLEGAGTVGNGAGNILTASSVNGSEGLDFVFKFTAATPVFNNAAESGNDLLRLTGGSPFTLALNSSNTVTLDFSALTLDIGDSVLGGFFTSSDNLSNIENARYSFIGLGDGYGINVSMIQHLANFSGGAVNGYITEFTVVAIPEPTSIAMVLIGGGFLASRALRRKKVA